MKERSMRKSVPSAKVDKMGQEDAFSMRRAKCPLFVCTLVTLLVLLNLAYFSYYTDQLDVDAIGNNYGSDAAFTRLRLPIVENIRAEENDDAHPVVRRDIDFVDQSKRMDDAEAEHLLDDVDESIGMYVTPYSATDQMQPKRINECRKGDTMGLCASDKRIAYAVELIYPVWVIDMPKFARPEHREWFLKVAQVINYMKQHDGRDCQKSKCKGVKFDVSEKLVFHNEQYTYGHLVVLENGVYAGKPTTSFGGKYECEWPSSYTMLLETPSPNMKKQPEEVSKAAIFIGPQATSFQHFMDRLMPDIAQAWDLVGSDFSWTLVGPKEASPLLGQIWKHLFQNHTKWVPSVAPIFKAKEMLYPCRVPRFHPWIWQRMRSMLGVVDVPLAQRTKIVYFQRTKSRKVLNENEVVKSIQEFVIRRNIPGEEFVLFNHSRYPTLKETRRFFNHEVKAVIGPHGGAFYNINFCPRDTLVIEFFPIGPNNTAVRYPEGTWWQAACLQHNYYMIPASTPSSKGDIMIEVDDVISIMEREL